MQWTVSLLLLLAGDVQGVERVEIFVYLAVHFGRFQVVLLVHTLAGHVLQHERPAEHRRVGVVLLVLSWSN